MKARRDDALLHDLVFDFVCSWDPYGLLADGASPSEFEPEVQRITARALRFNSEADAVRALSEAFSESFEPANDHAERFIAAGIRLYELLHSAGLVPRA